MRTMIRRDTVNAMRLAPALLLTSLTACSLLVDLGGLSGTAAADGGASRDGAGGDVVTTSDGAPSGDAGGFDSGPFVCDRTQAFCDNFDDPGDGGLQRAWLRALTRGGGSLALLSPGLASPGALGVMVPATASATAASATMTQLFAPVQRLTLDYDLFVESLPSPGELAVANIQIQDDTSSAAIDLYMGAGGTGLYNAVGDVSSSSDATFTPTVGGWTHVREEVDLPNNRMSVVFDGRADRTITVTRDLSSIKAKSCFLLMGLSHYAGQPSVGAAGIRVDNVLVNTPAL
jgi:hypothetical protein